MYSDPKSVRKESDENLVRSDLCSPEEIGFNSFGQDLKVGLNHLGTDNDDELIILLKKYISKELPNYWVVNDIHFIATILRPILIIHCTKSNLCQESFIQNHIARQARVSDIRFIIYMLVNGVSTEVSKFV